MTEAWHTRWRRGTSRPRVAPQRLVNKVDGKVMSRHRTKDYAVEVGREIAGSAATAFPVAAATAQGADSVVFVPSDVARLAATGRPQLVEFYHPG